MATVSSNRYPVIVVDKLDGKAFGITESIGITEARRGEERRGRLAWRGMILLILSISTYTKYWK